MAKKNHENAWTCKFTHELDLEEMDAFIKKFLGLAIHIARLKAEGFHCSDRHLIRSSALEGLACAFTAIKIEFSNRWPDPKLENKIIATKVRNCLFAQAKHQGILPNKGTRFFPKGWISWDFFLPIHAIITKRI